MPEFTFVQIGELYTNVEAETLEDAQEQYNDMTREELNTRQYFKTRDSYWL